MATKTTLGLTKIEFAPLANDKGPGTVFTQLNTTKQDTAEMTQDDPTTTEFLVEESDTAIESSVTPGKIQFNFTVAQPDLDTLVTLFGGEITGTGASEQYEYPDVLVTVMKTVKITPKKGLIFQINNGQVVAKFNGKFSKSDIFGIDVTINVLQPEKAGIKPLYVTRKA